MKNIRLFIIAALLLIPLSSRANMIWSSLYIVQDYYSWYVIASGLLIEYFAAFKFLKTNWKKSALVVITMNAMSAIIGLLLIPLSGIIVEILTLPFGGGTFQLSHWILDYIAVVLCNVLIEGLSLKLIFKYSFVKNLPWLLGANGISVVICILIPLIRSLNAA